MVPLRPWVVKHRRQGETSTGLVRMRGQGHIYGEILQVGRWRYVHVDDRIPCGRNGTPHFARSINTNEVWVMVVEKAYAKLHGCYEALAGGTLG